MSLNRHLLPLLLVWLCAVGRPVVGLTESGGYVAPRPLAHVLEELEQQYLIFFTYDAALVDNTQVEFELIENEPVRAAIDRLLAATDLRYESFGEKYFVLYAGDRQSARQTRQLKRKLQQLQRIEDKGNVSLQRRSETGTSLTQIAESASRIKSGKRVQGQVTDPTGETLMGVNIAANDGKSGGTTDGNGQFDFLVPPGTQELTFSYLGYAPVDVSLRDPGTMAIVLRPTDTALEEVVVIGYGRSTHQDATGSVQGVTATDFPTGGYTSPDQLLSGRVAGLQWLPGSGEPGAVSSIRIRGATSLNASNEPLIVIDGVPIDHSVYVPDGFTRTRSPLSAFDLTEVESISVLKDASATAIYGARAANGVILITSKRAGAGTGPRMQYESRLSMSRPPAKVDVMDAAAYRQLVGRIAPDRGNELGNTATDWQEQILRTGWSHNHTFGMSQGNAQRGYRLAAGYLRQEGIIRHSSLERLNASLNFQHNFFNEKIELSGHLKSSRINDDFAPAEALALAVRFDPTQPIGSGQPDWGGYFEYDNDLALQNPVAELVLRQDRATSYRQLGNLTTQWRDMVPHLTARISLGYDLATGVRERFLPSYLRSQYATRGEIRIAEHRRRAWLGESYVDYDNSWGQHRLQALAGYSYHDFRNVYPEVRAWQLPPSASGVHDIGQAGQHLANQDEASNRLISFFGRLNYGWHDRYLLTLSLRHDGSSRFGLSNRWGQFPALALAWKVSEEAFWQRTFPRFDLCKIRFSWGLTGNQEIGDYRYLNTYLTGDRFVRYQFGDEFITTIRPNGVDPDLKWEQTRTFNLGVDMRWAEGKLTGTLDLYHQKTTDLLSEVFVAAGSNLTDVVLTNIGSMANRGIELGLSTQWRARPTLSGTVGLTGALNHNRILQLSPLDNPGVVSISTGRISGGIGNQVQILQEGQPLYAFYVFDHLRDAAGNPLVDGVDHNEDGQIDLADIYADLNQDGLIDAADKRPFQQPAPTAILGLQASVKWGKVDVQLSGRAHLGNYVYNDLASELGYTNRIATELVPSQVSARVDHLPFTAPQYFSDYYVENASFFRMDRITIGYRPTANTRSPNLYLYTMLQNAFVLTSYSGLDPEVGNTSGRITAPSFGIDRGIQPRSRTLLVGARLNW